MPGNPVNFASCIFASVHTYSFAQAEGSMWRAMALLVAGGQLHAAATVLRDAGAVDAAYGLAAACREACTEAGLASQVGVAFDSHCSNQHNAC